jgi:hypothetical protein
MDRTPVSGSVAERQRTSGTLRSRGFHKTIRRFGGQKSQIIQSMMHMRLRDAAETGQPPLGQLTTAHPDTGDVDQPVL